MLKIQCHNDHCDYKFCSVVYFYNVIFTTVQHKAKKSSMYIPDCMQVTLFYLGIFVKNLKVYIIPNVLDFEPTSILFI